MTRFLTVCALTILFIAAEIVQWAVLNIAGKMGFDLMVAKGVA